jgi:hypothetical protein
MFPLCQLGSCPVPRNVSTIDISELGSFLWENTEAFAFGEISFSLVFFRAGAIGGEFGVR